MKGIRKAFFRLFLVNKATINVKIIQSGGLFIGYEFGSSEI